MGIVKNDEIKGYRFEDQIVCPECATEEELKNLQEDEIILDSEVENSEDLYFCDRCKKQLK